MLTRSEFDTLSSMHFLAAHYRSEFLATPQLLRLDYCRGLDGFEPTLLIKGSSLMLKYITLGVQMQLAFASVGDRALYALKVADDKKKPGVLWSILERDEELSACIALMRGETCQTFLFNELAINVAWAAMPISTDPKLAMRLSRAAIGPVDYNVVREDASRVIDRIHAQTVSNEEITILDIPGPIGWNAISNTLITSHATSSVIDFFGKDEGSHQEQLGIWLTDNLHPQQVHHSPQIPQGKGFRELTDILMSHEYGSILVESKALAVFSRASLPSRSKLGRDVAGHIAKAVNQLRGGVRQLKAGTPVTSRSGATLEVERTQPTHGIVLIPELDLVEDRESYGLPFITQFMKYTGGFLHLLDVAELLRIVQAAEMIAARGQTTTPMMAFDFYLMERVKKTLEAGTLCIEVLLRFADD